MRLAAAALAAAPALAAIQLGLLSDLHIGEGCPSPYNGTDDCYSVQNLQLAIQRINDVVGPADGLAAVFITGDITSSYVAAARTSCSSAQAPRPDTAARASFA